MYTKKYDENGLLTNPITKEKPFVNIGENREQRRFMQRKSNNRKGNGMVVFKSMRYKVVKQITGNGLIVHNLPC